MIRHRLLLALLVLFALPAFGENLASPLQAPADLQVEARLADLASRVHRLETRLHASMDSAAGQPAAAGHLGRQVAELSSQVSELRTRVASSGSTPENGRHLLAEWRRLARTAHDLELELAASVVETRAPRPAEIAPSASTGRGMAVATRTESARRAARPHGAALVQDSEPLELELGPADEDRLHRLLFELHELRTAALPVRLPVGRIERLTRQVEAQLRGENDNRGPGPEADSIDRAISALEQSVGRLRKSVSQAAGTEAPAATGAIAGTVTVDGSGTPIPGVEVYIWDSSGSYITWGNTDENGDYQCNAVLETGSYFATTYNYSSFLDELYDDFPCAGGECLVTAGTPIAVTDGSITLDIDFALAPGGAIAGTITDAGTGLPIENVEVDIYDSNGDWVTYSYTDSTGNYQSYAGLLAGTYYARTYNSSNYLNELYDNLPCPFSCNLTSGTPITVTAGTTTPDIDFALALGGSISGTVTDAGTGNPLENVRVRVYNSDGSQVTSDYSDASGNYQTPLGLPTGTYFARTTNFIGYLDELHDDIPCSPSCTVTTGTPIAVTAGASTDIDFALAIGGSITGTVTDAVTGLPIPDTYIPIYGSGGNYVTYSYTDANGFYQSYAGLPAGTYYVRTSSWSGYLNELYDNLPCPFSCTVTNGTPIAVTAGAATPNIDFALALGGAIAGTITDVATGLPIPDISVNIYDSSGDNVAGGYTDSSGTYQSDSGLPTGTYYARTYNSSGYLDELYNDFSCPSGSCTVTNGTPITVTAGVTTPNIDFALALGGSIAGTVTDAGTGLPLENVEVGIYDSTGDYITYGYTDWSGNYQSYTGLLAGAYFARTYNSIGYLNEIYNNLTCSNGSCTVTNGTPITVTAGVTTPDIDFALALGGSIAGNVTDAGTGLPIEDVYVEIYDSTGDYVTYGYTDSSGNFQSQAGLLAGTYYARTYDSSGYLNELYDNLPCPFYCTVTSGTPITVAAGVTTPDIDFALARGGSVAGTVTDAGTGSPIENVRVRVYDSNGTQVASDWTDASGNYLTPIGLPTGTYYARTTNFIGYLDELHNNIPCSPSCTVTTGTPIGVTAGVGTDIDFALALGGSIAGTVTDAGTGLPIESVEIEIYDSSGDYVTYDYTDSSGNFQSQAGLLAGTYYARTYNSSGYLNELYNNLPCPFGCTVTSGTAIVVNAGATTSGINFALALGGAIAGTVTDAVTALPIEDVEVDIYDSNGDYVSYDYTDSSGNYQSGLGLPSGAYYARTYNTSSYIDEVYNNIPCVGGCTLTSGNLIGVSAGVTTPDIDFALTPGGAIAGTLTDETTGGPIQYSYVDVYDSNNNWVAYGYTGSSGNYQSYSGFPTGTYFAVAYTYSGYRSELWDDIDCHTGCDPTSGDPIGVTLGAVTPGIHFSLNYILLIDGFESGDPSGWSSSFP